MNSALRDTLQFNIDEYGDNWRAYYATAEVAYYQQYGKLPDWKCFIDRIDTVNDSLVIVHSDVKTVL